MTAAFCVGLAIGVLARVLIRAWEIAFNGQQARLSFGKEQKP